MEKGTEKQGNESNPPNTEPIVPTDMLAEHVKKLSLRDGDVIVINATEQLTPEQIEGIKDSMKKASVNNFVLVLNKDFTVGRISTDQLVKMLTATLNDRIENKGEANIMKKLGWIKKETVLELMNEASVQKNKTIEELFNEFVK